MSIALRVPPSRPELKSRDGSGRLAPRANVSFTTSLYVSPVQTIPLCDQTGTPIMLFDAFRHFRSSVMSESASRIRVRIRSSVSSRQSTIARVAAPPLVLDLDLDLDVDLVSMFTLRLVVTA